MVNCDRTDCKNKAKYGVILELRVHAHHEPATSSPIVYVCEEHKDVQWDDIITAEGWLMITSEFSRIGKYKPSRAYSNLALAPIEKEQ